MLSSNKKKVPLLAAAAGFSFFLGFLYIMFRPGHWRSQRFQSPYHQKEGRASDISNSTLGFERIYVVNLPSRTDRRDALVLMAAAGGIKLNWVDGVSGDAVADKALPPPASHENREPANIGSWRAHLNALQHIVENNIQSALILEDDADWDVRIREQLEDFALSSRILTQPLLGSRSRTFADPSFLHPLAYEGSHKDLLMSESLRTEPPLSSPYGDNWDLLWLGHCGVEFPNPTAHKAAKKLPRGRVPYYNDVTVPEGEHLAVVERDNDLKKTYPPHTRVVHHAMNPICSLVYGVTQKAARKLLYEFGVKKFDLPFDLMLGDACMGKNDRLQNVCLTVQPQLFNHHRPAGNNSHFSDISTHQEGNNDHPYTQMIRQSARMNLPKLVTGEIDFVDQFPDKNKPVF